MKLFILIFFTLLFTSCNFLNDSEIKNELSGKNWKLVEINKVSVNTEININFGNSTIEGYNSCNEYNGEYKINNNELSFYSIISTKVGCINNNFENDFMIVLNKTNSFLLNNNELSFQDKYGNVISKFKLIQ